MGSLFAALTTAVSGLNAQSSAIGNISENLANAQTTGYKSVNTQFEQLVNASNATINNPGGVIATPQYQNDVQGSITASNTATSLAISGQGFFAVETATIDSTGTTNFTGQNYYTRQGDFTLDKNGYLVNGSGYYLTGYGITASGAVNTSSTSPIQISALLNDPVAAKNINYSANLPSNAAIGYTAPASTLQVYDSLGNSHDVNYTWTKTGTNTWNLNVSVPSATDTNGTPYSSTIPFTFNDGTGGTTAGTIGTMTTYTAATPQFTMTDTLPTGNFTIGNISFPLNATGNSIAAGTATSVVVTVSGTPQTVTLTGLTSGASTGAGYAANLAAAFAQIKAALGTSSQIAPVTMSNTGAVVNLTETTLSIQPDAGGSTGQITWNSGTSGADGTTAQALSASPYSVTSPTTTGSVADATVALKFPGSSTQTISLNFGAYGGSTGVTQFSNTAGTVSVSNFAQDGLPQGSFNSVAIDTNGNVSLNYSNGTNKTIAQIPVAQFYAQDKLQQVTGGAYTSTLASGSARLGSPGVNGAGTLSSNSLEQSNVDISTQFTNLIQAQQVYTANAKVVTTDNSLLQVTLNMIQ